MPSLVRLRKYNNSTQSEAGYCDLRVDQLGRFYLMDETGARTDYANASDLSSLLSNHISAANPHTQYILNSLLGANNGVAQLDAGGKVPTSQLPSYVDDVLEYANLAAFPAVGETGKIYVTLDSLLTYRWSGSAYVEISKSLAIGTTSTTAAAGDHTHANATEALAGFISALDQAKLNKLEKTLSMSAGITNNSNSALSNLSDLVFSAVAGKKYRGELWLYFQTAASTTGIGFTMSTPTGVLLGICRSVVATDGTAALYSGALTASGDLVISTGVQAANTGYLAIVEFIFICTANGNVTPQFRSEVNNSAATMKAGTILKVSEY